jgi:hypothetical protein
MTVASDAQVITTPTVRSYFRRWLFWILLALVILFVAIAGIATSSTGSSQSPLSPTDPSPQGAKAMIEVLKQQGVKVTVTSSLKKTEEAATDPSDTTIVLYDYDNILSKEKLDNLSFVAQHLVLIDPSFTELQVIAPSVAQAGVVKGDATADCSLTAVTKAGKVTATGKGFRLIGDDSTALRCLGSGDDTYSLIQLSAYSGRVTVLGTTGALSNDLIAQNGNAALALNLLGETSNLIWYVPGPEDLVGEDSLPTIAELTPGWVIQVTLLLALTAIFAGFWRGRRMGPLIVENLPVTVRASETMHGRARLYGNSSARLHALDSLRIGTIERIGTLCGLPTVATVNEVSDAAAAATGRNPVEVHRLLLDAEPASDKELVELSDALLRLEKNVADALRPR